MSEQSPIESNPYQAPKADVESTAKPDEWPLRRVSGLFGLIAFAYGAYELLTSPYFQGADETLDVRRVWRKAASPWRVGFAFIAASLFCLCFTTSTHRKTLTIVFSCGLCLFVLAMLLI